MPTHSVWQCANSRGHGTRTDVCYLHTSGWEDTGVMYPDTCGRFAPRQALTGLARSSPCAVSMTGRKVSHTSRITKDRRRIPTMPAAAFLRTTLTKIATAASKHTTDEQQREYLKAGMTPTSSGGVLEAVAA